MDEMTDRPTTGGPTGAPEPTGDPEPTAAPGRGLPQAAVLAGGVVVGVVLAVGGLLGLGALKLIGGPAVASPSPATALAADGSSLGLASAPVTIEIWADFQCPFCGLQAHGIEPAVVRDQVATGAARLTFRDFAFLGQESIDAAVAARCAEAQGRFWDYHDLLYASQQGENQGTFARANLVALARFVGLDETTFSACLDDATVAKAVTDETAEGQKLGVQSTPTLRIVGPGGTVVLSGVKDAKSIAAAVRRAATPAASPGGSPTP